MKSFYFAGIIIYSWLIPGYINPVSIRWKRLADVRFDRKYNKEEGMYFLYPTFGSTVKELEGKEIKIKGYMIPVDETANIYVISAQPMSMCFFCGGSGPESIIELQFRNKGRRFKTDAVKTVTGKLKLNPDDITHLNYILTSAEVVD